MFNLKHIYNKRVALINALSKYPAHNYKLRKSFSENYNNTLELKLTISGYDHPRKLIAISQVEHLGDIVASEPVIKHIRQTYPDEIILFSVSKTYHELVSTHPFVDHTLPLECVSEWEMLANTGIFDIIFDLNIYGRHCEICRKPWVHLDGNNGINYDNYYAHGNLLQAYAKSAGLDIPNSCPQVFPTKADSYVVDRLNLPELFVCIHAQSNETSRDIPNSSWHAIIQHITKKWNIPIIEIGLQTTAIEHETSLTHSLCGKLSILQSAEVIRRACLFVGIDSGPSHLANAVGTYGIIALGWYHTFKKYLPYSGSYGTNNNSEILYHDGPVSNIDISRILGAIDRRLSDVIPSSTETQ